jgi:hypothetical protein
MSKKLDPLLQKAVDAGLLTEEEASQDYSVLQSNPPEHLTPIVKNRWEINTKVENIPYKAVIEERQGHFYIFGADGEIPLRKNNTPFDNLEDAALSVFALLPKNSEE